MRELIRKILNEEISSQVRRRIPKFEETFKHYRKAFIDYKIRNFEIYWNLIMETVSETLYHAWFINTVPDDDWDKSEKFIQDYLTKNYHNETEKMWEKKHRKRLNESGKDTKDINESGKYTRAIKELVKIYEDEDFVCDIDAEYYEAAGAYIIIVRVDKKEMETYYENETISYATERIRDYLGDLYRNIYREVKTYFPVEVAVHINQTKCSKKLNESEDKNQSLLSLIEEHGLYEFMKMTSLSLPQIYTKTGELPREVFERYIKDFLENDEIGWDLSIQISPNKIVDSFYLSYGVVTIGVNEVDSRGRVVAGSFERLSVLSDEEIFSLVNEMSQINDDYFDYM